MKKAIKIIEMYIRDMIPEDIELDIENLKKNKEETRYTALLIKRGRINNDNK